MEPQLFFRASLLGLSPPNLLSHPVRVSIAVKRHPGHGESYKGKHFLRAGLQFRGSVHLHHGGMQVNMVLEKELRVLHLDSQAAEETLTLGIA